MLKENSRMLESKKQSTSIRHEVSSKNYGQDFGRPNFGLEDGGILDRRTTE